MTKSILDQTAIEIAAQCWCDDETSNIEMDARLANAFATRLQALIDVAKAAEKYKSKQDEWGQIGNTLPGHYEAWIALGKALAKLRGDK